MTVADETYDPEISTAVVCDRCSIYWDVDASPPAACPNCGGHWQRSIVLTNDEVDGG